MQGYLMGLLGLAVCCAVVELLSPEGEGGGIARHIRLMSGLCLLCVAVTPLVSWGGQVGSLPERLGEAGEEWIEESEDSGESFASRWQAQNEQLDLSIAAETLAEMIEQRFSLAASDCRVSLATDGAGALCEVRVAFSGRAIWVNAQEVKNWISELLGCECTVYIE